MASLALVPVLLELGFRGWLALQGQGYDAAATETALLATVDIMTQPLPTTPEDLTPSALKARSTQVVHPFFGFDTDVGVRGITKLLRETSKNRGEASFTVLVVGGSVSGMVAKNGAEALRETLAADPRFEGVEVLVRNQGRGSFKQPQQLMLVSWLLSLGMEPDAIVNVDGFNEVALGGENQRLGVHPTYPHWPRWGFLTSAAAVDQEGIVLTTRIYSLQEEARATVSRAIARGELRSAVLGRVVTRRVARLRADWAIAQSALVAHLARSGDGDPAKGPPHSPDPVAGMARIVGAWTEASRNLQALCDARGIAYVHVLQPTLHDVGSKPLAPKEAKIAAAGHAGIAESVQLGYPHLRSAGAELAASGVPFVDASMLFEAVEAPLYVDVCHFRPRGCAMVGRAIGAALLEQLP